MFYHHIILLLIHYFIITTIYRLHCILFVTFVIMIVFFGYHHTNYMISLTPFVDAVPYRN